MTGERLPFIDWMKALGMFLIVFGHVAGGQVNLLTPPIYHKQWGVTFFMFVTGYTLARETRPALPVVVNRLFEIVFITGTVAVIATLTSYALGGRGQLSNFLPLFFGVNVLFDNFPANPTTWYVGTYIHVIVLWAVVRRHLTPTLPLLGASLLIEPVVRWATWHTAGAYIAYMTVPNWMTVLLLGCYAGQHRERVSRWVDVTAALGLALPIVVSLLWLFDEDFPFRIVTGFGHDGRLLSSVAVTALYAGVTWLAYRVTSRLPHVAAVEFFARQTIVIFVLHMPLYYALQELIGHWPRAPRGASHVLLGYVGLAFLGHLLYRVVRPAEIRAKLVGRLLRAAA